MLDMPSLIKRWKRASHSTHINSVHYTNSRDRWANMAGQSSPNRGDDERWNDLLWRTCTCTRVLLCTRISATVSSNDFTHRQNPSPLVICVMSWNKQCCFSTFPRVTLDNYQAKHSLRQRRITPSQTTMLTSIHESQWPISFQHLVRHISVT